MRNLLLLGAMLILAGCARASAGAPYRAERIAGAPGVDCYVGLDSQGTPLGISCVR